MRKEWPIRKLGDLSDLITKGTTPTSVGHAFVSEGINFIKVESISSNGEFIESKLARISQDCHDSLRRSQLKSGDILFSIAGALGRTAFVNDDIVPANTNQALAIIRLKESTDVLPEFVLRALSTGIVLEQIDKFKGGVAQQNLSLAQVQNFQIILPPLPEQKRIVTLLDEAFEGIAAAEANAEKNIKNARELFESHLQSIFTHRGEGWVEKTLAELGTITSSKRIFKSEYVKSGVPFYRTKEIKELANGREITTELFISKARYKEIKDVFGVPTHGDILLTAIGTIGEIYVVNGRGEFYFKDGNVLWLKGFDTINPHFLRYILISFVQSLNQMAHGTAYNALPIQRLKTHKIALPSPGEQTAIVSRLDSVYEETQRLESIYQKKVRTLEELKKSLLHQAFNGAL